MRKKLFTFLLTIFMLAAVFCGSVSCGTNSDDNSGLSSEVETLEEESPAKVKTSGDWTTYYNNGQGPTGTYSDPIKIYSAEDLANIAVWTNDNYVSRFDGSYYLCTAYYELCNDIDLSAHYWVPIGTSGRPFKGHFNGNGHTIYGMYINKNTPQGLFGKINGAYIENVNVIGNITKNNYYVGGIAAWLEGDDSEINNCTFDGTITLGSDTSDGDVGGIVGSIKSTDNDSNTSVVKNCIFYGTFSISEGCGVELGGIVGSINARSHVEYCANLGRFGTISLSKGNSGYVGGIVGYSSSGQKVMIWDCINYCSFGFSSSNGKMSSYVGGILGYAVNKTTINRCINYGDITGSSNSKIFGGIVGQLGSEYEYFDWGWKTGYREDNALTNCINLGDITATEKRGLVGVFYGDRVYGCFLVNGYNYGNVYHEWPSDLGSNPKYITWESRSVLGAESFYSNGHDYDYKGTIGGHNVSKWHGDYDYMTGHYNYDRYWTFNTTVYDLLSSRSDTYSAQTLGNFYGKTSPILKDFVCTFKVKLQYKKNNSTTYTNQETDAFYAQTTDGTYSATELNVKFLKAAPYEKYNGVTGRSNMSTLFKLHISGEFLNVDSPYLVSVVDSAHSSEQRRWHNLDVSVDSSRYYYGENGVDIQFPYLGTRRHAFDSSQNVTITIGFKAEIGSVQVNMVDDSGNALKGNTATIYNSNTSNVAFSKTETSKSVKYYYKDDFKFKVTPRMGYKLKKVTTGSYNGTKLNSSDFSRGTIDQTLLTNWYKYNISKIYFVFEKCTYNVTAVLNDGNNTIVGTTTGWEIGKGFILNQNLDFGYKYYYTYVKRMSGKRYYSIVSMSGNYDMDTRHDEDTEYGYLNLTNQSLYTRVGDVFGTGDYSETELKLTQLYFFVDRTEITYDIVTYRSDLFSAYENITKEYQKADAGDAPVGVEILVSGNTYKLTTHVGYKPVGVYIYLYGISDYTGNEQIVSAHYIEEGKFKTKTNIKELFATLMEQTKNNIERTYSNIAEYTTEHTLLNNNIPICINVEFNVNTYTLSFAGMQSATRTRLGYHFYTDKELDFDKRNDKPIINGEKIEYFSSVTLTARDAEENERYVGMYVVDGDNKYILTHEKTYTFAVDPYNVDVSSLRIEALFENININGTAPELNQNVYKITSVENLIWLSNQVRTKKGASSYETFEGKIFRQENNIDMSGVSFNPIGGVDLNGNEFCFSGTYDGNGYEIQNLEIDEPEWSYVGLFGLTKNATIKNLTLNNCKVNGYTKVGTLVGHAENTTFERTTAYNCDFSSSNHYFYNVYKEKLGTDSSVDYKIERIAYTYKGETLTCAFEFVYRYINRVDGEQTYPGSWAKENINLTNTLDTLNRVNDDTKSGIGGLVGTAYGCQFFASAVKNGSASLGTTPSYLGRIASFVGYVDDNCVIDECYADAAVSYLIRSGRKILRGRKNALVNMSDGSTAQITNCFWMGSSKVYSSDSDTDEEKLAKSTIWFKLNGDWELRVFYW